ncbi:MAG: GFA family protein [bacterium]
MIYQGSCHCGKIAFTVEGEFTTGMDCNCSMCRRRGGLLAFVPREALVLQTPVEDLGTYHFNRHVIDHHFCPTCGIAPFGDGKGRDGKATAAINLRCLPDLDLDGLTIQKVDGRSF